MKFDLVCRFRDDAALYYPTRQKPTGKKGRPKLYDGKIDMARLDTTRVQKFDVDNGGLCSLAAYSKSLKQMVRLVICWRSSIASNSSLLTGFIKIMFAGKDRKKPFSLKWVFYRKHSVSSVFFCKFS